MGQEILDYEEEFQESYFQLVLPSTRNQVRKLYEDVKKYTAPRGIASLKNKCLMSLCEKNVIFKQHQGSFEALSGNKEK